MKIVVQHDDGTEEEITEGVQIAYDCVVHSMDWGSGFLDTEEVDAVVELARRCRFPDFERIFNQVQETRLREEEDQRRGMEELKALKEAERKAAERQVELIAQMRRDEPDLAGYSDEVLRNLHQLRRRDPQQVARTMRALDPAFRGLNDEQVMALMERRVLGLPTA